MIIKSNDLMKTYEQGKVKALNGVDLCIEKGDYVSIMGPSGSGKSTLLYMIGALERPTSGQIMIDNHNLQDVKSLAKFRANTIGFVFQLHNLIPSLTAMDNILVPAFETKRKFSDKKKRADKLLRAVGLGERMHFLPTKLSGGERQRVAIARALINKPKIILADEPTGDIDSKTGGKIMDLLEEVRTKEKTTLIVVTHDPVIGHRAKIKLSMIDGKVTNSSCE